MHHPTSVLYRIIDSFCRYKWRFLLAVILIGGVVGGVLFTRPKEYVATGLIQIIDNTQMSKVMGDSNSYGWQSPSQVHSTRFNNKLHDDVPGGFLSRALKAAKLQDPIVIKAEVKNPRLADLLKNVYSGTDSTDVFSVTVKWPNQKEAERLARSLREEYIETYSDDQQANSLATSTFLNGEIARYEKELKEAEEAVSQFKKQFSGQLPDQQNGRIEQLSLLHTDLDTYLINARTHEIERKLLSQRLKQIKPKIIVDMTYQQGPSATASLIQQKEAERNAYRSNRYKDDSTIIRQINKDIARLKTQLVKEERLAEEALRKGQPGGQVAQTTVQDNPLYIEYMQKLFDLQNEEKMAAIKIANLRKRIAQYEKEQRALPLAEKKLNERLRRLDVVKSVYTDLLEKKFAADIQAGKEKRVGRATLQALGVVRAESTAGLKKTLISLIIACVLGLVVGGLTIITSEWLDTSLRYAGDAEAVLEVPVLACLPEARELGFKLALPAPDGPEEGTALPA
ncbi:MAG: hypothetical protein SFU56_18050 [Capsulimonadales bacterium]|nr:hypothetical protein [Capsulimonadales bacterium]